MATTVPNNPFDVQAEAPKGSGIVAGAISNLPATSNAASQEMAKFNPMQGMAAQSYTPQTREVNRSTETVAGQVESLLSKDNPLLQRARTIALQNMNQRGLVNSSMAQGAGAAAMIDRVTPIAGQDAQTFSQRALANMDATNEANQFNVGQNNQLFSQGLGIAANRAQQEDQQKFQAGESALDRSQQTSLQVAQFDFQKAQAELDRAFQATQQDKSIKAQVDLQTAQQNFQQAQNALDRAQQSSMQQAQFEFQGGQSALDRAQQSSMQQAQFQFQGGQAALDRAQQTSMQQAQIEFQRAQSELDRAFQATQQDKSVKAQMDLQTAQQNYQSAQAALDRAQQTNMQQSQIASNERLTMAQIEATAKNLNTQNQAQMEQMRVQIENNKTEGGKAYASNLAAQANAQINALLADGNLDPTAKQAAIDNVIKTTNASLQWASTFYNTTLPAYTAPGGANSNIAPASRYTQSQANDALRTLVAADPNANYQDVVKSGTSQGYTLDQINAAFDALGIPKSGIIGRAAAPAPAPAPASAPAPAPAPSADVGQLGPAFQRGDIATVNSIIAENGLSTRDVQRMYGLSDADISWARRQGVAFQ